MRFTLFFSLFLLIGTAYGQETKEPDASSDSTILSEFGDELPVAPDEPMVFEGDSISVTAVGTITPDTPAAFVKFMEDQTTEYEPTMVEFHSNGGDILAAMALGREIRKRGLSTQVFRFGGFYFPYPEPENSGLCRDACFWAFLGGRDRYGRNMVLRTYRPPSEKDGITTGKEDPVRRQQLVDIAYISQYAHEMGFDMRIAYIDWQNPKPHVFTHDEVNDLGISINHASFGTFTLQPFEKGVVAMAKSNDGKSLSMFYCNAKKQPIFQMKGLPLSARDFYEGIIERGDGADFFGFNFPTDKGKLVVKNDSVEFTLLLSNFDAEKINLEEDTNRIEIGYPGALTSDYPWFSDVPSLKTAARIAMKNCL